MSVVSPTWLSLSGEANYIRSTYIDGFLDVSSSRGVLLRSDVSFGSRLIMSTSNFTGTVTPNSTAARLLPATANASSTWINNAITWTSSASYSAPLNSTTYYSSVAAFNANSVTTQIGSNYNSTWGVNDTYLKYSQSGIVAGTGTPATTIVDTAGTLTGEWLQIQSSVPVVMKNYQFGCWGATTLPRSYWIVGSTNGTTWYRIQFVNHTATTAPCSASLTMTGSDILSNYTGTQTNGLATATTTSYTTSGNAYSYFRIICLTTFNATNAWLEIGEWNINFTPATSAITLAPSTTAYGQLVLTGGLTTTQNISSQIISSFSTQASSYASPYTALKFTNTNAGSAFGCVAMDFSTYDTLSYTPAARISFLDANYSADTIFSSKVPGAITNAMAERMRITGVGNVGIGTNNPTAILHVNGDQRVDGGIYVTGTLSTQGSLTASSARYNNGGAGWSTGGSFGAATNSWGVFCGNASGRMACTELWMWSDIRMKENIKNIEDPKALDELRKLQPKTFNYIDNVASNSETVYGFIAQEVELCVPNAVTHEVNITPNIFEMADLSNGNMVILRTKSTALFNADADGKDTSGNSIKIKVYDEKNREYITTIVRIIDDTSFEISDSFANSTLFVYGQEVHDFRCLQKDAIYTITVAALQQIDREYRVTKQEVVDLKTTVVSQQSQIDALVARLAALENK